MGKPIITFSGWPWQTVKYEKYKYGWNPLEVKGYGRFGGGWAIKLGVEVSRDFRDVVLNLLIGSIRIKVPRK